MRVIDGDTGKVLKKIEVAPKGGLHNLVVSHDGKKVVVGSTQFDMLSVIDTAKDEVTLKVGPIIGVIQPLTINADCTVAYINTHLYRKGHGPGFEIGDLKTGKILHVVGRPDLKDRKTRCHGIGLTPDEKEVWVVDQDNKEMHVFDNTVMPPKFKQAVPMAAKTHGWICFSRDGKYGWCDTGEVFDTATKKVVAQWTDKADGKGNPVTSSKFFEIDFRGKEVVWVGQQMGVGYRGVRRVARRRGCPGDRPGYDLDGPPRARCAPRRVEPCQPASLAPPWSFSSCCPLRSPPATHPAGLMPAG